LHKIFEPFGAIQELIVLRDRQTGVHKGCAFLTYATKASAGKAISYVHEKMTLHQV
jgi:CUG-BP- and ETR3-like factor